MSKGNKLGDKPTKDEGKFIGKHLPFTLTILAIDIKVCKLSLVHVPTYLRLDIICDHFSKQ